MPRNAIAESYSSLMFTKEIAALLSREGQGGYSFLGIGSKMTLYIPVSNGWMIQFLCILVTL